MFEYYKAIRKCNQDYEGKDRAACFTDVALTYGIPEFNPEDEIKWTLAYRVGNCDNNYQMNNIEHLRDTFKTRYFKCEETSTVVLKRMFGISGTVYVGKN